MRDVITFWQKEIKEKPLEQFYFAVQKPTFILHDGVVLGGGIPHNRNCNLLSFVLVKPWSSAGSQSFNTFFLWAPHPTQHAHTFSQCNNLPSFTFPEKKKAFWFIYVTYTNPTFSLPQTLLAPLNTSTAFVLTIQISPLTVVRFI